ncbi:GNAT family N-acetyltransferase [Salinisphaera sp. T31B1]|uniref:GNAT family N-acetyltransferase n=1 Tax=Salinisphaera sp. T31B1 TaxID=727963 RepID=UPI00333FE4A1
MVIREQQACGYIQIQPRAQTLHLANIALARDERGQGIGSRLIGWLQATAAATGRDVSLAVFRTNTRAASFYTRHGFLPERTTPTHDHLRWCRAADRVRPLNASAGYTAP